jgi:hypothetical protein
LNSILEQLKLRPHSVFIGENYILDFEVNENEYSNPKPKNWWNGLLKEFKD